MRVGKLARDDELLQVAAGQCGCRQRRTRRPHIEARDQRVGAGRDGSPARKQRQLADLPQREVEAEIEIGDNGVVERALRNVGDVVWDRAIIVAIGDAHAAEHDVAGRDRC